MIIELLLAAFQGAFFAIFKYGPLASLQVPAISDSVMSRLYDYVHYLSYARDFISFFIPSDAFAFGVKAFLLLFAVEKLYPVLMWIIRKIPLINVS